MKTIFKVLIVLVLAYSILFKSITGFFDFLNKNRDMGFWTSFFESDLPNIVGVLSMLYLTWLVIKSPTRSDL